MTDDCNADIVAQARRNVADSYVQTYHINAIMSGDWDNGTLVKEEVARLLKQPPLASGEESDG
jgi:hypothetical protein